MVSTRGFKPKFTEGERVLCYEPDPTKAKVLYESKVLQVLQNKDARNKKLEYLIHFQGWNSSWDRCVDEDMVVRDDDENRQLQKTLLENAHIKQKEKKKKRRLSDTIREIVQDRQKREKTSSDSGSQVSNTDEDNRSSSPSDLESLASGTTDAGVAGADHMEVVNPTEEVFMKDSPVVLSDDLKAILERDFSFIKEKGKLVKLPSTMPVFTILENHVAFFANRYLARTSEKRKNELKLKDRAFLTLDLCKEVMDGLRICFDFHCSSNLLYAEEQKQFLKLMKVVPTLKTNTDTLANKQETVEEMKGSRRLTRSGIKTPISDHAGQHTSSDSDRSTPSVSSRSAASNAVNAVLPLDSHSDLSDWTLLPEEYRQVGVPALVYGPMHLLRLLVKLPEIIYRMNVPAEKKKIILKHVQLFIEFLSLNQLELFPESIYVSSYEA